MLCVVAEAAAANRGDIIGVGDDDIQQQYLKCRLILLEPSHQHF